ncbi:ankyrin repeat-containing domain protein, partial [Bombardia bombarda]
ASISSLPTELVVLVLENLDRLKDLSSLARADRKLYSTVNSILYKRAVSRDDAWPLAWAAHCGVAGTLRKALAAGANPNHEFTDGMRLDVWMKTAAARQTNTDNEDSDVWESDNEYESNVEWLPETDDSDHNATPNITHPTSTSSSHQWDHILNDSDRDSDVSMDEPDTQPSDAASSTLDENDHEQSVDAQSDMQDTILRRFNPIHLAARRGHNHIIEILLDHGASVNRFSERLCGCRRLYGLLNAAECPQREDWAPSWSPLHIAICHSRSDTAKLLLSRKASYMMEVPTDYGGSPHQYHSATALHHAAARGLVDVVQYLLHNAIQSIVDVRDEKTLTPFYYAYANRRWDTTVPYLLGLGANIDVDTKLFLPYSTITPLGEACRLGNFADADRLIDLGADVTRGYIATSSGRGLTPLHMCCMPSARPVGEITLPRVYEEEGRGASRMRTIQKLVTGGAPLDAKDCTGDTALIIAAQNHNVPALRALIKAGANIHQRNAVGRNAVMQAFMGPPNPMLINHSDNMETLAQTVKELLDGGARLDEVDSEGNTVLHLVFRGANKFHPDQTTTLRLLLNKPGVSGLFQVRNRDNHTALRLAFQERNLDACEVLVRRGCFRGGINRSELLDMFKDAALVRPGDEATLDFVLDLDVDGHLTSDPALLSTLLAKGGHSAVHAAQIISHRGLPPLPPGDHTRLLCKAIRLGELFLAYSLLEAGADVNVCNDEGEYPLAAFIKNTFIHSRIPVRTSAIYQFLQALLDRGANIHLQFAPGSPQRILHRVIALDLEEALFIMLEKQPLINDPRAVGCCYLHWAVVIAPERPPNEKIIDWLIVSGANLSELDGFGDTPLSVLLKSLCKERMYLWRYHRFIKALLGPDVDVNRKNNDGKSIVDYLEDLMYPSNSGQGSFLTRRIQLVDVVGGGKAIKFLPRPHKRFRPDNLL